MKTSLMMIEDDMLTNAKLLGIVDAKLDTPCLHCYLVMIMLMTCHGMEQYGCACQDQESAHSFGQGKMIITMLMHTTSVSYMK
jgi:hypothetical protein